MAWYDDLPEWLGGKPPDPNAEPSPGTLTKAFANPWISVPAGLGLGVLSALGTRGQGARIAGGLTSGLELGLGAEKGAYNEAKQKRLSDAVGKMIDTTVPTDVTRNRVNPMATIPDFSYQPEAQSQYHLSDMNLSPDLNLAREPMFIPTTTTENKPAYNPQQQAYLRTLQQSGNPAAALAAMGSQIFKEPTMPHVFGGPEVGYHSLSNTGVVTPLVAGTAKNPSHIMTTVDAQGNKVQKLMTEDEIRQAGTIRSDTSKRIPPDLAVLTGTPQFDASLKAHIQAGTISEDGVVAAMAEHRKELSSQRQDASSKRAADTEALRLQLMKKQLDKQSQDQAVTETVAPLSPNALKAVASTLDATIKSDSFKKATADAKKTRINNVLRAQGVQLAPGVDMKEFLKSSEGLLTTGFNPNSLPVVAIPKVGKGRGIPQVSASPDLNDAINNALTK